MNIGLDKSRPGPTLVLMHHRHPSLLKPVRTRLKLSRGQAQVDQSGDSNATILVRDLPNPTVSPGIVTVSVPGTEDFEALKPSAVGSSIRPESMRRPGIRSIRIERTTEYEV